MSKKMQNLVVFMEPFERAWLTPLKGGNMILNRFCIDEDAAFELSGVYSFKKWFEDIEEDSDSEDDSLDSRALEAKLSEEKGKEYSF